MGKKERILAGFSIVIVVVLLSMTVFMLVKIIGAPKVAPEDVLVDNSEWRADGGIGLITDKYSDIKVENVNDAIRSLEDVKDILNIGDVSAEFIPFDDKGSKIDENTYKVQQVYEGVPVANAQTIIGVDGDGYPNSLLNRYDPKIKLVGIDTNPSVSEDEAKKIILDHLISKNSGYTNGEVESIRLEIQPEERILTYNAYVTCDGSLGYDYYIDAHTGAVLAASEVLPQMEYNPNGSSNPIKMWGLETDIFYDSALDEYVYYNANHKLAVYDKQAAYIENFRFSETDANDLIAVVPKEEQDLLRTGKTTKGDTDYSVNGFYAVYNHVRVSDAYKEYLNLSIPKTDIWMNFTTEKKNAWSSRDGYGTMLLAYSHDKVRNMDTVGHEITHYFQVVFVNSPGKNKYEDTLGDFFVYDENNDEINEQDSSNLRWIEAKAISEGTADIMGMLCEALNGEVSFNSDNFWIYDEDKNYKSFAADHKSHTSGDKSVSNETVSEMNTYWGAHPNVRYGNGPGHFDRYILPNAFYRMIRNSPNTHQTTWFKLWGEAIKLLTPASDFADMRLALLQTAKKLGMSDDEKKAIKKGLDEVGITDGHNANPTGAWYIPYVNKAFENGVISATEDSGFRMDGEITRAELLSMVLRYCNIDVDHLELKDVKYNHWAAHEVQLGYNYGVLTDRWLTSAEYLDQTIPRWEAANVLFGIMNISEVYHSKTNVCGYPLDNMYEQFKASVTGDWGVGTNSMPKDKLNCLNMNRGHINDNGVYVSDAPDKDPEKAQSRFIAQHQWTETEDKKADTDNMILYFGMYQLYVNGKLKGRFVDGKVYLAPHDSITRGEVCGILYINSPR